MPSEESPRFFRTEEELPLAQRLGDSRRLLMLNKPEAALDVLAPCAADDEASADLRLERDVLALRIQARRAVDVPMIERAAHLVDESRRLGNPLIECEALQASGLVLSRLHLFGEALERLGQAEALALRMPGRDALWPVLAGIARVLYDAELHQERIDFCERSLSEHPDMPQLHRASLLNLLGGAYKWQGDQLKARELYLQALQAAEACGDATQRLVVLDNLANSCAWTGHFDEGWAYLHRTEALMLGHTWTDDQQLWHAQARALLIWKGGDAAGALPVFEEAARIGRKHVQLRTGLIAALSRLAEAAEACGATQRAADAYKELLALTQQRSREQAKVHLAALGAMVSAARLEAEKASVEQQRLWLESRVAERTLELSAALARLQAEVEMRRATEGALQEAHDEMEERVQQRTAELEQAMQFLLQREKLAALGQLVAGVAHELNTPIGNARVAASTLVSESSSFRQALDSPQLRRSQLLQFSQTVEQGAELVDRSLDRAAQLIQRFRGVASPESLNSVTVEVDLVPRLADTVGLLRAGIDASVQWALDLPESLPAKVDVEAVLQILAQLIDNAWRHGLQGRSSGRIAVRLSAQRSPAGSDEALLQVQDDGHGIKPEHLGRVFEPFFTTRLGQGGSGLGLYRAYKLATELLRGDLSVQSLPGTGSCFELRFPLG